jgi:hypothetical protein
LFFSVRWYIKRSGHSYKIGRQAWAVILLWYSLLAMFVGLATIKDSIALGVPMAALWACVAFACWKWRQRLRRAEATLATLPAATPEVTLHVQR